MAENDSEWNAGTWWELDDRNEWHSSLIEYGANDVVTGSLIVNVTCEETGDFVVNEKEKNVNLTEKGVRKVEQFFHIDNLADADNLEIQHNIILALRANYLMFKDQDYVVKDDQILIVEPDVTEDLLIEEGTYVIYKGLV